MTHAIDRSAADMQGLARQLRLPLADLSSVSQRALEILPERWARKFNVLPLTLTDRRLVVATSDPLDVDCERTLAFATGRDIALEIASSGAIARRIDEVYRSGGTTIEGPKDGGRLLDIHVIGKDQEEPTTTPEHEGGPSVATLVDQLIAEGIVMRASDIHIEPEERTLAVRYRVDGVLKLAHRLSRSVGPSLVSRIKIMSSLDIADRLRPQDGGARVAVNGVAVDLRVSTLPASHGEKVVIRVLDARGASLALDSIGFDPIELVRIERLLESREGLILVTGPTGSGKTTTLYAALRRLKQRSVNIVTVEDPIEYRIPGIVQVQVNEKAGLTFAVALRSIMRQDPDVLLIGEIRDRETAEIAIQASLTGHLVLSTLHTNDAASAVTRLIDIGVAPYKIATAVKGVVAQRLVRRRCRDCADTSSASGDHPPRVPADGTTAATTKAAGTAAEGAPVDENACRPCGGTRFRGRIPIAEVLIGSPEFTARVTAGATLERLAEAARESGMRSLWGSGMAHVAAGTTTADEVSRIATPDYPSVLDPQRPAHRVVAESAFSGDAFTLRADLAMPVPRSRSRRGNLQRMAELNVGTVTVFVISPLTAEWRVLVLKRAANTRCPAMWETVHGRIEPNEQPEEAAVREVREEAGVTVERLYNVMVYPFYLHATHVVELSVVFAAFVAAPSVVVTGAEHQAFEWLSIEDALLRLRWPREREALESIIGLLRGGDAGAAEDVLRVM